LATVTGSIARNSLPAEGNRPQRWATAPVISTLVLVVVMFLHFALQDVLPNKVFLVLLLVVVIATALWIDATPTRLRGIGAVELAMALYLMWNAYSMLAPHKYPATAPLTGEAYSIPRMIMTSTVIPFVMYVVGRYAFDRIAAVRTLLWTILSLAAYSAAVSILQFTGPTAWVWPRFIVDGSLAPNETWVGRAVGVFNQPVLNGMLMAFGFAIAMLLISRHSQEPAWRRWFAFVIAVACGYGLYLTHTRAAWLSGAVVLIIGALLAKGYRKGFIVAMAITAAIIAINWTVFTSSDREAGGVASVSEVDDRLNTAQTALWAAAQKPLAGWGIGRYPIVNTYHHQQWSPDTPWIRGYAIVSHTNELGILAELGAIGLTLWICVLALVAYRLWGAYRTLPNDDLCGTPLAVTAIVAFAILFISGLTVDLRFFDFPTATTFLFVGIAIGWSDRHKRAQAAGGVITEPLSPPPQHG
jgi:O-antigen ligase